MMTRFAIQDRSPVNMSDSNSLRAIGVPEHFNLPWYSLAEEARVQWTNVAEGTGAMLNMLQRGETDIALLLTDGAVAGIAKGMPVKIVGCYIQSPLVWGVHVAANAPSMTAEDIVGQRFAISRFGSGSHLMASVYAQSRAWPGQALDFVVVDNLKGARRALPGGEADIFLWEVFTTKPYVDSGEFRLVDTIPTPWPAFVACVREDASDDLKARARVLLADALQRAAQLRSAADAEAVFAKRFGLEIDDAAAWLRQTQWSDDGQISDSVIEHTARVLTQADVLTEDAFASLQHWRA